MTWAKNYGHYHEKEVGDTLVYHNPDHDRHLARGVIQGFEIDGIPYDNHGRHVYHIDIVMHCRNGEILWAHWSLAPELHVLTGKEN
jgi:hypothetical protein